MATLRERTSNYRWFKRQWTAVSKKAMWYLIPLELVALVPCLVIFALAQPDLYRTDLWQIGFNNGLNSNPNMIVYAYANYQPLPHVPLVWSQVLTDLNVAISVISLFVLLTRLILLIMHVWYPIMALGSALGLLVLYAVSTYGQVGPDYADPQHPAPAAWYFRFGCSLAKPYGKYSDCQLAQASLGLTLYMLVLYLVNTAFAVYALWPNQLNNEDEVDDDDDMAGKYSEWADGGSTEMQGMPGSPAIAGPQGMEGPLGMEGPQGMEEQVAEFQRTPSMQGALRTHPMQSMHGMSSLYGMRSPVGATGTGFTPRSSPFTPRNQGYAISDQQSYFTPMNQGYATSDQQALFTPRSQAYAMSNQQPLFTPRTQAYTTVDQEILPPQAALYR